MSAHDFTKALTPDEAAFRRILTGQFLRYPRMEVQDLYKLIFQAARGSEHAVADITAARRWLERELRELTSGPEEPAIDPISPNGRIVRINLRPYVASRGDLAVLLQVFVRTAYAYQGTESTLRRYWCYAEQMAADGLLPFPPGALRDFFTELQAQGLPAVHHSTAYVNAYRPAYRVVVHELLSQT
jgi:hypothetical protein